MSHLPSASRLARALICPASATLPQVESTNQHAERGKSIHEFIANHSTVGREKALELVPDAYKEFCSKLHLDTFPKLLAHEVAFAWDHRADMARELGRDIKRGYERFGISESEFVGTADLVGVDGDSVFIADIKTGWGWIEAPKDNMQLRALALFACRAYGKQRARVAIVLMRDETPYWDFAELDAFDLAETKLELQALVPRIEEARRIVEAAQVPTVQKGLHCKYCPAMRACPAAGAFLTTLAMMQPEEAKQFAAAMIARGDVFEAYVLARIAEENLKHVFDALKLFASVRPIILGNGYAYGPTSRGFREYKLKEAA